MEPGTSCLLPDPPSFLSHIKVCCDPRSWEQSFPRPDLQQRLGGLSLSLNALDRGPEHGTLPQLAVRPEGNSLNTQDFNILQAGDQ